VAIHAIQHQFQSTQAPQNPAILRHDSHVCNLNVKRKKTTLSMHLSLYQSLRQLNRNGIKKGVDRAILNIEIFSPPPFSSFPELVVVKK
jgi:hypothetical protein